MKDLIYNQTQIPREQWRYGFRASADTGCGWIAVYNALRLMDYSMEPQELIAEFERRLPLIHGNMGTTFWTPAQVFRKWGFPVEVVLDPEKFDEKAEEADVSILFFRWREKWKMGAHFAAVQKQDGSFVGYNTFRNSVGPDRWGGSIREFLKRQKYFGAVLIAVRDKRKSV